jgi:hypothetical protein
MRRPATRLPRIPIKVLQSEFQCNEQIRNLFVSYSEMLLAQAQQTVACNALHTTRERICRWLLMPARTADARPATHPNKQAPFSLGGKIEDNMMIRLAHAAFGVLLLAAAPALAEDVQKAPPPAPYKKVSELVKLPDFLPGMGTLYVDPKTLRTVRFSPMIIKAGSSAPFI